MNTRAKWAYLPYDSMIAKIQDGTLDSYDVCYCPDRKENYVISPSLEAWAVRSRIYVFSSIDDANTQLNFNSDTYIGQIVSVLDGDKCKGYIVNKNVNGVYYVDNLVADDIDYNTIGNRPIENLVGTLVLPIYVDTLSSGIYKIKGQYKISASDVTTHLSVDGDLFIIETSDTDKFIKRFTKDTIQDFTISDNGIEKKTYITDKYLTDNGYSTTAYVNNKFAAFEATITQNIQVYVEQTVAQIIEQKVDEIIDERLDIKLDARIKGSTDEEVQDYFN